MDRNESKSDGVGKSRISVIELSEHSSPVVVENPQENWVEYGIDNDYFEYLIELSLTSTTNGSAIGRISDLIYGQGLDAVRKDKNVKGYAEFKSIFKPNDVRFACKDLKTLGWAAFLMVKNKNKTRYVQAKHWPGETLRPEKANSKSNQVEAYYYAPDWSKVGGGDEPKRFEAFGFDKSANESILIIKGYTTGSFYFNPVDYEQATKYAAIEAGVSNYHFTNVENGFSPTTMINFNNGEPPKPEKEMIEQAVKSKFSGTDGEKILIAWNDDKEHAAEVETVQLSDADKQYDFISKESKGKLLTAHGVTTPAILGIQSESSGLGNNAEELKNGFILFDNMTIRPFQDLMIEGINRVLHANEIVLDLFFKTLQPLEFTDLSGKDLTPEEKEKELGLSMSKEMSEEDEKAWIELLKEKGETIDLDVWEEVEEIAVSDDEPVFETQPIEDAIQELHLSKWELFKRFADPNDKSKDDKGIFLIRYRYGPQGGSPQRTFCVNMVAAATAGVIYRREDIDEMSAAGINSEFAEQGKSKYSIWLYKGGVNCHHKWNRVTFRRKIVKGKIIPLTAKEKSQNIRTVKQTYDKVANSTADKEGVAFKPTGWKVASTKTIDLPNQGRVS